MFNGNWKNHQEILKGEKLYGAEHVSPSYMLPYSSTTWWGFFWAWEKLVIDLKNIQMTPFFRLTEDYCIIFEHGDYFSTLIDDFQRPNHSINWFWLCVYLAFIQRFVECCRYKDAFFCQLLNTYLIPYRYIKLVFFSKGIGELKWGWGLGKVLVVLCLLQMEKMNIRVHFWYNKEKIVYLHKHLNSTKKSPGIN